MPIRAEIEALRGRDRRAIVGALVAIEAGTVPADTELMAAMIDLLGEPVKEISRRAAGALATLVSAEREAGGGACHEHLVAVLDDEEPRRRWGAAFALATGGHRDGAVVAAAVEALATRDGDVRWAAAEIACTAARERPELVALIEPAVGADSPVARKMALYCLRDLGVTTFRTYAPALADPDRGVRLASLAGLVRCDDVGEAAVAAIVSCLEGDPDVGVRRSAAVSLGKVGPGSPGFDAARDALERVQATSDDADLVRAAGAALAGQSVS